MPVSPPAARPVAPPYPTAPTRAPGPAAAEGVAPTAPAPPTRAAEACPAAGSERSIWEQLTSAAWTLVTWPFVALLALGAALAYGVRALWADAPVADEETQPLMSERKPAASYPSAAPTPPTPPAPPAAQKPAPAPAGQVGHGTASMRALLSPNNDTDEARARNRASYLRGTTQLGHWGGQFEAVGLAAIARARTQIWLPRAGDGASYVCHAVLEPEGTQCVDLKLDASHYRPLLPLSTGTGAARVAQGSARGADQFREVDVLGAGDCLFLAFAYADDTPYVRELTDFLNARKAGTAAANGLAHLRANAVLVESLALEVGASATDDEFARKALESVVRIKRVALARELAQPKHRDSLDAVVAQVLAEN